MTGNKNQTVILAEPDKQEIFVVREFDAPREIIFKAYTDPKLYVQWLGPRGFIMKIETFEKTSGGRWRYIHIDPQGNEFSFHGINHEVLIPERIIGTFEYEGSLEKGHVMLETVKFEELPGGRTKVTTQSVFQSISDRDGMLRSGMELGQVDSHERLDELLERLQNKH